MDELLHFEAVRIGKAGLEGIDAFRHNAVRVIEHGQICFRHGTDADGSVRTHDLRLDMVAMGGRPADMDRSDRAVFEFVNRDSGLIISRFPEFRMLESSTHSIYLRRFRAQEPAHQVDIMDRHVDEDSARRFGKADASLHRGFRVDAGRLDHVRGSDRTAFDLLFGIRIGWIEASHEAEHKREFRVAFNGRPRDLAFLQRHAERFVAEYMLAGIKGRLDLPAVLTRRRDNRNRIEIRILHHFPKIRICLCDTELLPRVFEFRFHDGAGCHQLRSRNPARDISRVNLAQTAEACDTEPDFLHSCLPPEQ